MICRLRPHGAYLRLAWWLAGGPPGPVRLGWALRFWVQLAAWERAVAADLAAERRAAR